MRKFATLRNEILNININGLELRVRADKIDFLFSDGDPIIRWCVNHMVTALDRQRQNDFENDMPICVSHSSTAKLPEGVTLDMTVQMREEEDVMKWGSYMHKGARGTAWDVHGPENDNLNPRTDPYPNY